MIYLSKHYSICRSINSHPGTVARGSIQRLAMKNGYDSRGLYWGTPDNVWCAQYQTKDDKSGITFVRANSREIAIETANNIFGWENIKFRKK